MDKRPNIKKRIALELFRSIKKNRAKLHELRTLFWECTLRCNVSCRHCGSDCHVSASVPDMPVEDFLKVIDDITPYVEPNKVLVIFTGGEALVRKDIEKCGLELYRRGYPWGIVSNGYLMTRERLDSLLASGLHSATISLDGFEEAHNWLRRNPKSFEKALNAICMLAEEKDLQLTNEQFTWLMNFIRFCRKEGKIHVSYGCEGFLGNYEAEVRDSIFQCNAGINTASVLADGAISGCPSIRANFHQGNIYKDDFIDIWNNEFKPYRNRQWAKKGECADCKMFRYCEGNGMHLYDDEGNLLVCHYKRLVDS